MIPFLYRLKLSSQVPFRGSKSITTHLIIITQPAKTPAWAVQVSRTINKRAVVRNKYKRQILNYLYQQKNQAQPVKALIIIKNKPETIAQIIQELSLLLLN